MTLIRFLVLGMILPLGCARSGELPLKAFYSDGCSLFPDKLEIKKQDWCDCCFDHDLRYWMGGTEEERLLADLELRECVLEKTGDSALAELMYRGVRFGGSPYFYSWYRWGYGWNYDRKYKALNKEELGLVEKRISEYFDNPPPSPCDVGFSDDPTAVGRAAEFQRYLKE